MKIFISYATEDRNLAEQVTLSLRNRGHTVFFDRTNLPPSEGYEKNIEKAIGEVNAMVFLVSPESITSGRFTLTELRFAQDRWASAHNRVLPVMVRKTPIKDIPNYLRSVTILEPVGNIPAEVAASVDRMARRWAKLIKPVAAFLVIAGIVVANWFTLLPPAPVFSVEATAPHAHERGFFGKPDLYHIGIDATNKGKVAGNVVDFSLEVDPPGALTIHDGGSGFKPGEPTIVAPGADFKSYVLVSTKQASSTTRWRVCLHFDTVKEECSPFANWEATHDFPYGDHFPIRADLIGHAKAIGWDGENYLVAAANPNRIVRMDETGKVISEATFNGVPTAISTGTLGIFIGMGAPDKISRLNFDTLQTEADIPIAFNKELKGSFGGPVSSTPVSMAQDGTNLWVITRGGASANGLAYLDANLKSLRVPSYYGEVSFDLPGMTLRNGDGAVWTGQSDRTPASIYKMTADRVAKLGGHDYEIVSCASDVMYWSDKLLVPDCDGKVKEVLIDDGQLRVGGEVDSILGYKNTANIWQVVRLGHTSDGKPVGAVTTTHNPADSGTKWKDLTLSNLGWKTGAKLRLDVSKASIVDMVVGKESALMILESDTGTRQLVSPGLLN